MDVLFVLVPLSLVLVAVIVVALLWAARSGQFEDLEGPAYRILSDDDSPRAMRASRDHDAPPPRPAAADPAARDHPPDAPAAPRDRPS